MNRIFISLLMFISFNCYALDGNKLFMYLGSDDKPGIVTALAYITGVADAINYHRLYVDPENKIGINVCFPDDSTTEQARDVVKRYLEDNPDKRQFPAYALSVEALLKKWPCKKDQ